MRRDRVSVVLMCVCVCGGGIGLGDYPASHQRTFLIRTELLVRKGVPNINKMSSVLHRLTLITS